VTGVLPQPGVTGGKGQGAGHQRIGSSKEEEEDIRRRSSGGGCRGRRESRTPITQSHVTEGSFFCPHPQPHIPRVPSKL
jgi:hypothetical protein